MYLLANFGGRKSFRNGYINSYINSYIDILKKTEITPTIRYIARFLKSEIPIFNSAVPDTTARKTRRRTQGIANHFAFHANAISQKQLKLCILNVLN